MEAVMTTTTATWPTDAIVPSTTGSISIPPGTSTVYYIPDEPIQVPKTVTLASHARVNKSTLASGNPSHIVDQVKKKLIKDLMEQLIQQNLIKVSTDVGATSGRTTFTCTLEVVDPREQAKS